MRRLKNRELKDADQQHQQNFSGIMRDVHAIKHAVTCTNLIMAQDRDGSKKWLKNQSISTDLYQVQLHIKSTK